MAARLVKRLTYVGDYALNIDYHRWEAALKQTFIIHFVVDYLSGEG